MLLRVFASEFKGQENTKYQFAMPATFAVRCNRKNKDALIRICGSSSLDLKNVEFVHITLV